MRLEGGVMPGRRSLVRLGLVGLVLALPAPAAAQNILAVEAAVTGPGSPVAVVVSATNDVVLDGYQISLVYDNAVLEALDADTAGLDVELILGSGGVEFAIFQSDPAFAPGQGCASFSVIFDVSAPFEGQTLPVGVQQSIAEFAFATSGSLGTCTTIEPASASFDNLFVWDSGQSLFPTLVSGDVCFVARFERGDVNADGFIDIADPVFALESLFILGSPAPSCVDAADANDDGTFDVTDPVVLLAALFVPGTPPLPEPTSCGIDPTPDPIDCVAFPGCP